MADNKGIFSWIITGVLLIVGVAVGWSIWSSLKDTRAKLAAQKDKMEELERRDASMRRYVDSLDVVLNDVRAREALLAAEREEIQHKLENLQREHAKTLARLDKLWEAKEVTGELDNAFPHWAGQFWDVQRSDGVHGLLAPRFFGAEVAEIKAENDKRGSEIALKDSTIASFNSSMTLKDDEVRLLTMKADSIRSTYDNLWNEYQALDKKYRKEVASRWFKVTVGGVAGAAAGFGVGYLVGK
ncbi:hypothetical protein HUU40_03955 [candidate division KSB1 bacterium]|nr:hypothetical protein [candidate division KSB1 bacterium]